MYHIILMSAGEPAETESMDIAGVKGSVSVDLSPTGGFLVVATPMGAFCYNLTPSSEVLRAYKLGGDNAATALHPIDEAEHENEPALSPANTLSAAGTVLFPR